MKKMKSFFFTCATEDGQVHKQTCNGYNAGDAMGDFLKWLLMTGIYHQSTGIVCIPL